jgi:hypothetical protein
MPSVHRVLGLGFVLAVGACSSGPANPTAVGAAGMSGSASGVAGSAGAQAAGAGGTGGGMSGGGGAGGAGSGGVSTAGGGAGGAGGALGGGGSGGALPMGLPDGPSSGRHTAKPLGSTGAPTGYWEYLPPGYGDTVPRPLLVFFHGIGENGNGDSELDRVLGHGPPMLIEDDEWPSERPFVVLSSQHTGDGCPSASEIDAFYDYAIASYTVDPARIYLTGLSCGANGSWSYLAEHGGEVVAAAALIAGGQGDNAWQAAGCKLGEVALWAFHGGADGPEGSTVPIEGINQDCPNAKEAKVTVYPGVGHVDSWVITYDLSEGHDPYTWLLGFNK